MAELKKRWAQWRLEQRKCEQWCGEGEYARKKEIIYSRISQNAAPLDFLQFDLMLYTWIKGYNGTFTTMELDRRYSARSRKSGGRVSPTCITCQIDEGSGPAR